ncbi:hypothetical protein ACFQVD_39670 [Streptosporangium amethystogenes subsp. fukuiense]|uniref:Uncharacterized protein n=1 Tax=Streptosporangium amethystogenes subsp. fukuiense TaxID=698418 RepID=A0ABW2TDS3_9ACTN
MSGFTYPADAIAGQTGTSATALLSAPLGAAVLPAYALIATAVAVAVPLRRDIT